MDILFASDAYSWCHPAIFADPCSGRMDSSIPRSKRLLSDERSNIFIYMTGHGGNEFLKFQDNEEISAFDIADAFEQMYQKKRYSNTHPTA
jgi:glycosylphosphatidylinositol transamidase (GPIT) subunit GPI8